jgi:predicted transcriptional regulator
MWKVNQFTKGLASLVQVLTLSIDGRTARQDKDKANILIETFFPIPPMPEAPVQKATNRQPRSIIVLHQITIQEATRAIFTSNPKKGAGVDGLTFKVWQEL